jgi:uracil-DNA glycosylase
MRPSYHVRCEHFPCQDVNHAGYIIPDIDVDPDAISIIMISEASPTDLKDYYYAGSGALFEQTTRLAFNDAGVQVSSMRNILALGVYLTTAVKCGKLGYGIQTGTVKECSLILEQELALFPQVKALLLMGDIAIQAVNAIARRAGEARPVPAGSTYKIRGGEFYFRGSRVFPSYLQAGPSFFIEKSKRKMIAEDLRAGLDYVK